MSLNKGGFNTFIYIYIYIFIYLYTIIHITYIIHFFNTPGFHNNIFLFRVSPSFPRGQEKEIGRRGAGRTSGGCFLSGIEKLPNYLISNIRTRNKKSYFETCVSSSPPRVEKLLNNNCIILTSNNNLSSSPPRVVSF